MVSPSRIEGITNAVLYEGYMLYPYRPSAIKNRQRINFGVVVPENKPQGAFSSERSCQKTECLLRGSREAEVWVEARFLQLVQRNVEVLHEGATSADGAGEVVEKLEVDGQIYWTWQEARERRVEIKRIGVASLLNNAMRQSFSFDAECATEPIRNAKGQVVGQLVRRAERLCGTMELAATPVGEGIFRIAASVRNTTDYREDAGAAGQSALMQSFLSAHKVLRSLQGEFVSLIDPPEELRSAAGNCNNEGTWPVLASERGEPANVMLSSPIILYDYPEIAPESAGDLFDATEIDEILGLRILTLTDEEKREMSSVDERTRAILQRTERLAPENWMSLHGAVREGDSRGKDGSQ